MMTAPFGTHSFWLHSRFGRVAMNTWRTLCHLLLTSIIASTSASAADVAIADVVEAWKRRERAAQSFSADLWEFNTVAKGTLGLASKLEGPIPPADHERIIERTLLVDGDQMRHACFGDAWDDRAEGFVPETMTSASDGTTAKSVHQIGPPGDVRSIGFIHSRSAHPDRLCLYLGSVLKHFRPFSAGLGAFHPERWELVETEVVFNGSKCIRIREGKIDDRRYRELFVDPERDYALVRYRSHFDRRIESELTTSFAKHDQYGWIPDNWEVILYSNGRLVNSALGSLEGIEMNLPIAEKSFDVTFPVGTDINDHLLKKVWRVMPTGEWQIAGAALAPPRVPNNRPIGGIAVMQDNLSRSFQSRIWSCISAGLILIGASIALFSFRRRHRIACTIGLFVVLVLIPIALNLTLAGLACGACGPGCLEVDCIISKEGDEYALEDVCPKFLRIDPSNDRTLVPGGPGSRFQLVDNFVVCFGSIPLNLSGQCSDCNPENAWSMTTTVCGLNCEMEP
jgi:hypothetical protein